MYKLINKSFLIIFISLSFLNLQVFADGCVPCQAKDDECDLCYEKSINKPYDQGLAICKGALPEAYNAPGNVTICDGMQGYVKADFIYWQALGDYPRLGILYNGTAFNPIDVQRLDFSYDYEPGFKVGIGKYYKLDNWNVFLNYTRLHTTNRFDFTFNDNSQDFSTLYLINTLSGNPLINFQARWERNLDKADLELARLYYMGRRVILRPFAGVSGHWISQKYDFLVFNNGAQSASTHARSTSWALGSRFGMDSEWIFWGNTRVFANLALSLLYASNKTTADVSDYATASRDFHLDKERVRTLRHVEELIVGFGWGAYLANDRVFFDATIGYETECFSNTNYYTNYIDDAIHTTRADIYNPGNLFLHGLIVSARLNF